MLWVVDLPADSEEFVINDEVRSLIQSTRIIVLCNAHADYIVPTRILIQCPRGHLTTLNKLEAPIMADEKVYAILYKLQQKGALTSEEIGTLQSTIDQLEQRGRSSHHETTSHHHTTAFLDIASDIRDTGRK
jgi:hypothetical protein